MHKASCARSPLGADDDDDDSSDQWYFLSSTSCFFWSCTKMLCHHEFLHSSPLSSSSNAHRCHQITPSMKLLKYNIRNVQNKTSIWCTRLTLLVFLTCQIWQLSESFGLIYPGAFAVRLIFPALGASGVRSARTVKPTDICAAFFSARVFLLLAPPGASPDLVSSPPSALKSWQSLPLGHSFWGSTKITLFLEINQAHCITRPGAHRFWRSSVKQLIYPRVYGWRRDSVSVPLSATSVPNIPVKKHAAGTGCRLFHRVFSIGGVSLL